MVSATQNLSKDLGVEAELDKKGAEGSKVGDAEGVVHDGGVEEAEDSEVWGCNTYTVIMLVNAPRGVVIVQA